MALRDEMTDSSRDGSGQKTKADVAFEPMKGPANIAEEARLDAMQGRHTQGTASDDANVTAPLHRRQYGG